MGKTQPSSFTALTFCYLNQTRTKTDIMVERLPPEWEVVSLSHSRVMSILKKFAIDILN